MQRRHTSWGAECGLQRPRSPGTPDRRHGRCPSAVASSAPRRDQRAAHLQHHATDFAHAAREVSPPANCWRQCAWHSSPTWMQVVPSSTRPGDFPGRSGVGRGLGHAGEGERSGGEHEVTSFHGILRRKMGAILRGHRSRSQRRSAAPRVCSRTCAARLTRSDGLRSPRKASQTEWGGSSGRSEMRTSSGATSSDPRGRTPRPSPACTAETNTDTLSVRRATRAPRRAAPASQRPASLRACGPASSTSDGRERVRTRRSAMVEDIGLGPVERLGDVPRARADPGRVAGCLGLTSRSTRAPRAARRDQLQRHRTEPARQVRTGAPEPASGEQGIQPDAEPAVPAGRVATPGRRAPSPRPCARRSGARCGRCRWAAAPVLANEQRGARCPLHRLQLGIEGTGRRPKGAGCTGQRAVPADGEHEAELVPGQRTPREPRPGVPGARQTRRAPQPWKGIGTNPGSAATRSSQRRIAGYPLEREAPLGRDVGVRIQRDVGERRLLTDEEGGRQRRCSPSLRARRVRARSARRSPAPSPGPCPRTSPRSAPWRRTARGCTARRTATRSILARRYGSVGIHVEPSARWRSIAFDSASIRPSGSTSSGTRPFGLRVQEVGSAALAP